MWEELISLIRKGDITNIEALLKDMTTEDLEKADSAGDTALMIAAQERYYIEEISHKICELLVEKNPNIVNISNNKNETALKWYAANYSNPASCELLIPLMSDKAINLIDQDRSTSLIAISGNYQMKSVCEMIIPRMNNMIIMVCDNYGNTVLTNAQRLEWTDICEILHAKISNGVITNETQFPTGTDQSLEQQIIAETQFNKYSNPDPTQVTFNYESELGGELFLGHDGAYS